MGSDQSPHVLLQAAHNFAQEFAHEAQIIVLGAKEFCPYPALSNLSFQPCKTFISMEDNPLKAIRHKKDSSLCEGLKLLQEGKIEAFVTAGNSGALLAFAKMNLPLVPNILRPAFLTLMPSKHKNFAVLDVGANTQVTTAHLLQFALMGSAVQKILGCKKPKIALLNIGEEATKGTLQLRNAYNALKQCPQIDFVGNIEGKNVFNGTVDVIVTDGTMGNIFLKTAEGTAAFILELLHSLESKTLTLKKLQEILHLENTFALLCGLNKIVLKCHGNAAKSSIINSLKMAYKLVQSNFVKQFQENLET